MLAGLDSSEASQHLLAESCLLALSSHTLSSVCEYPWYFSVFKFSLLIRTPLKLN